MAGAVTNGGKINFTSVNTDILTINGLPVYPDIPLTSGTFANSTVVVNTAGQITAVTAGSGVTPTPTPTQASNLSYIYFSIPFNKEAMLLNYTQTFSLVPSVAGVSANYDFTFVGSATTYYDAAYNFNTCCTCCFNHTKVATGNACSFIQPESMANPASPQPEKNIQEMALGAISFPALSVWYDFQVGTNNENQYTASVNLSFDQVNNLLIFNYNGAITSPNLNLITQMIELKVVQNANNMSAGNGTLS